MTDLLGPITKSAEDESGCAVIVTGYVMLAECVDESGERTIYSETMDDQRCHTTLGLLSFGMAVESHRAISSVYDD